MLENVKKCKNFLAMLIKLACSGSQSPEMPEQTAQTSTGYTDGYSDDLTENAEGVQAFAGSMQAAAPGTEEEKSGIKLTFGE